jgi:hypothetical protein
MPPCSSKVLPQIPAAVYDSRDAILQQMAGLRSLVTGMADKQLTRLEVSVNCLINSQLGAAQLLAAELRSSAATAHLAGQISSTVHVSLLLCYYYGPDFTERNTGRGLDSAARARGENTMW